MSPDQHQDLNLRLLACFKAASGAELTEDDIRHLSSWEGSYHDDLPLRWHEIPLQHWRLYALRQLRYEFAKFS